MSKIGAYLQEHISGEVSLSKDLRESMSRDGSVLKVKPEMVIYPKNTNDIRKVARFSWQLAERGHVLPITARGAGSDETGAAIGPGIILSLPAKMSRIFEYEPKQRLVRIQPGVSVGTLSAALAMHGMRIPALSTTSPYATIGGALANNSRSILSGKYGAIGDWVDRLEVVLANGEVIQTGRIGKRELSRKIGLGTLEGEIYRTIDGIIEENPEVMSSLEERSIGTNAGYSSLSLVKKKDGSFDLTPLIVGSQGTLGIISEIILRAEPIPTGASVIVAAFGDVEVARDTVDVILAKENPAFLESFDSGIFEQATMVGKSYNFLQETGSDVEMVLLIGFDDNKHGRAVKKVGKILDTAGAWHVSAQNDEAEDLLALRETLAWTATPDRVEFSPPSILGGAYVPPEGVSVYRAGLKTLAKKYNMELPVYGQDLQSIYYVWPNLNLKKTTDKQKILKLLDDYSTLIQKVDGELAGTDGEGRLRSRFALGSFDDATLKVFTDVKQVFDPFKMLNPGVKEMLEIKQLVPMIQNDYAPPALPNYVPYV